MTRDGRAGSRRRIRIAAATWLTILALAAPGAVLGVLIGNRTPVARPDAYTVRAGGVLNVATPGVLANDSDADGDPLLALISSGPSRGTATLAPTGGLVYVPDPGFSGTDTFTYVVTDVVATSAPAVVTINVTPAPTPTPIPTPTPTLIPTPTPISVPSLIPIPIPIPSSVPTATPTPSGSAGPSPSVGPSPSPTASPGPLPGSSAAPGASSPPPLSPAGGVVGAPSAPPASPGSGSGGGGVGFSVPNGRDRGGLEFDAASFGVGGLDGLVQLALPAVIVSGPGLLLLLAIGAQAAGGLAWLPIARRKIGAFGVTPARRLPRRRART